MPNFWFCENWSFFLAFSATDTLLVHRAVPFWPWVLVNVATTAVLFLETSIFLKVKTCTCENRTITLPQGLVFVFVISHWWLAMIFEEIYSCFHISLSLRLFSSPCIVSICIMYSISIYVTFYYFIFPIAFLPSAFRCYMMKKKKKKKKRILLMTKASKDGAQISMSTILLF